MKIYRRLSDIRAISFDLDDTLYDNMPVIMQAEAELLRWLAEQTGHEHAQDKAFWLPFKQQAIAAKPELRQDLTLWRRYFLTLGLSSLMHQSEEKVTPLAHAAADHFLYWRNQVSVSPSVHHLLAELQQAYPLVAITNGNVDVEAIGLMPYFDAVHRPSLSFKMKPAADLFRIAQKQLGLAASTILHVGDHPISDVSGALDAGFRSVWLNHEAKYAVPKRLPDVEIMDVHHLSELLLDTKKPHKE